MRVLLLLSLLVPCAQLAAQPVADPRALLADAQRGSWSQRRQALEALGALGEVAVPLLPQLRALLDEPALRWDAVRALGEIGPFAGQARDGIRAAVDALRADTGEHALERERTLQRLAVDPSVGDDELIAWLEVPESFRCEFVAELLQRRSVVAAAAALARAVRVEHPPTLALFGRGKEISSTIFDGRPDEAARTAAARALVSLAGGDPVAVDAHVWLLQMGDEAERRGSAAALGRLGIRDATVIEPLVEALRWHDVVLVREAIASLSAIGPPAAAAVPRLQALCRHSDRQIAQRAAAALRRIHRHG